MSKTFQRFIYLKSISEKLVLSGAGIAQLADYFARPYLRSGALVELPVGYAGPRIDVHVFMPRRDHVPKRSRLLSDFLFDGLKEAIARESA